MSYRFIIVGGGSAGCVLANRLSADPNNRVPHLAFQPDQLSDAPILPMAEVETSYYLRMQAHDRPGVLAEVTRILGDRSISIEAILQKEPRAQESREALEQRLQDLQNELEQELARVSAAFDPAAVDVERVSVKPRKSDVKVETLGLVWV